MDRPPRERLRGPTLVAAPLIVIGLIGVSFALALGLWGLWNSSQIGASFWVPFAISAVLGLGGFAAARGCFVDIVGDEVCDKVGWITLQRVDRRRIRTARVRLGFWRWFELELDDDSHRTLLGASPAQFPARLLPGANDRDLADLDLLLGED
ncbi:hypothetical protein BH10ACT3_BH10ACT3_06680 [soil metagenome]